MKKTKFRAAFLLILFFIKIIIISWVFIMELTNGYSAEQRNDLVAVLAPLFSANIMIGLQYYFDTKKTTEDETSTFEKPVTIIAFTSLVTYFIFIVGLISSSQTEVEAFKTMKNTIAVVEVLFSGYLGLVIKNIFK